MRWEYSQVEYVKPPSPSAPRRLPQVNQPVAGGSPARDQLPAAADALPKMPAQESSPPGGLALELATVFAFGVILMSFIYVDYRLAPGEDVGVPGYDAYYHVKMAAMLPDIGLVDEFPWLRHVHFSQVDSSFISHHYGFHALLAPFVRVAHWIRGDYLPGGRWAISVFFGVVLVLLDALLIAGRVRWRWLWLIVFLMLPAGFFWRHSYVRAISPSLMFMLLIVLFMFLDRYVLAGLALVGYTHLYLGSVVYSPVIVASYAVGLWLGPRNERRRAWRLVMWTALGWLVGLRTYPYFQGALEFLRMQILGTGLNPDIAVGSEWYSYGNVWQFAVEMCGPTVAVWVAALALRVRLGGRWSARELSLLLLNFMFLLLTLKARRFIEYWPAFCLLSAAFMAAPVLNPLAAWLDPTGPAARALKGALARLAPAAAICAALIWILPARSDANGGFLAEWPTWSLLATAMVMAPLSCLWLAGRPARPAGVRRLLPAIAVLLCGAAFAGLAMLVRRLVSGRAGEPPRLSPGLWGWLTLVAVCGLSIWYALRRARADGGGSSLLTRLVNSATVTSTGLACMALVVLFCADRLTAVQRDVYCGFNLRAIRDAMGYLEEVSRPGAVVFTDDWDVFPVFFYHNSHNHYIVGLDPKFTHSQEPELWERYVKITRGEVPRNFVARWTGLDGLPVERSIHVEIEDIRRYFHADFVVTDPDHGRLASLLAQAPHFAELVYPKTSYEACSDAPYLVFRIRRPDLEPKPPPQSVPDSCIYLSDLTPASVQQGWGELTLDRSVSDEPIHLADRFYLRGLGTHAPLELVYDLPAGYDAFEATVGLNRSTQERGSVIVSVDLDGDEAYRSPLITADSDPIAIRVPLSGGRRLTLRADPTSDGNHWDHVDWAMARITRDPSPSGAMTPRPPDQPVQEGSVGGPHDPSDGEWRDRLPNTPEMHACDNPPGHDNDRVLTHNRWQMTQRDFVPPFEGRVCNRVPAPIRPDRRRFFSAHRSWHTACRTPWGSPATRGPTRNDPTGRLVAAWQPGGLAATSDSSGYQKESNGGRL